MKKRKLRPMKKTPFRLRTSSSTMKRAYPLRAFTCKASQLGRDHDLGNLTLVGSKVRFPLFHKTRMPVPKDLNFTEVRPLMKRDRETNIRNSLSRPKEGQPKRTILRNH
jgi:hypothetical protein